MNVIGSYDDSSDNSLREFFSIYDLFESLSGVIAFFDSLDACVCMLNAIGSYYSSEDISGVTAISALNAN